MKQKYCKGCGLEFTPATSLQQIHNSIQCYRKWQKTKVKTKEQKLRRTAGLDVDAQRRKCDALFQQVVKKEHPRSILSGEPTQVAHHRVKKSHSNYLRYYIPNGVPLTNQEHDSLHNRGNCVELEIDYKMGIDWIEDLNTKREVIYKLTMPNLLEIEVELRSKLKDNTL